MRNSGSTFRIISIEGGGRSLNLHPVNKFTTSIVINDVLLGYEKRVRFNVDKIVLWKKISKYQSDILDDGFGNLKDFIDFLFSNRRPFSTAHLFYNFLVPFVLEKFKY